MLAIRRTLQTSRSKEAAAAYLFLLPALIALAVFVAFPTVRALFLSFCRWDLVGPPRFVGLEKWIKAIAEPTPRASVATTFWIVLLSAPLSLAVGLLLAVALEKAGFLKVAFRSCFFAPFVASLVAVSYIWADLFDTHQGLINYGLQVLGMPGVSWLTQPDLAQVSVSIVLIWQSAGFNMLVYTAGLQSIDDSYYQAAIVDGAGKVRIFWNVTMPLLSPTTFFLLVMAAIRGLQVFELVYVLTGGGPGYSTSTLVYFIYTTAFQGFDAGLASAMSMILFFLIAALTVVLWRLQRNWVFYGE